MEYKLIIFNDNVNEFDYVAQALMDCVGCDVTQAEIAVRLVDRYGYYSIATYTNKNEAIEDLSNLVTSGIDCDLMTVKQYEKFVARVEKK